MRGKNYHTGLRGVLFEAQHYERMGAAVWLYAWLVLRQTHQTGSTGWVLGGAPVSYRDIEEETGFNIRTLERWMRTLRRHGYIETEAVMGGLIVRITKAKKYATARNFTEHGAMDGPRKAAGAVRKFAEGDTQGCVAANRELTEKSQLPLRINSSFIEKYVEEEPSPNQIEFRDQSFAKSRHQAQGQPQNPGQTVNPSCSGERPNQPLNEGGSVPAPGRDLFSGSGRIPHVKNTPPLQPWHVMAEARLLQQRLRAEREEAVRRELRVGRGPEIPSPARKGAPETPEENGS